MHGDNNPDFEIKFIFRRSTKGKGVPHLLMLNDNVELRSHTWFLVIPSRNMRTKSVQMHAATWARMAIHSSNGQFVITLSLPIDGESALPVSWMSETEAALNASQSSDIANIPIDMIFEWIRETSKLCVSAICAKAIPKCVTNSRRSH